MENYFKRTELLLGKDVMEKLSQSHIALFGLGGVGSFCAEALVRVGVGEFTLVDDDLVEATNINRQLHADVFSLGKPKVEVMQKRLESINPEVKVHTIKGFLLPSNVESFFSAHYDCVADAIDTISAKIAVAKFCHERSIPLVSCMGTANKLDPTAFRIADIFATTVDPIAKIMRKKLKEADVPALKVVYSTEAPHPLKSTPADGEKPLGSVAFVPPVAGMILARAVFQSIIL